MSNFFDLDSGSGQRLLWLDSTGYTANLLEAGKPPWLDVANFLAWQRKAQGLVRSDVISLPAEPVVAALIAKHSQLSSAMAAKPRVLFPLKTLLADALVREHLTEMLTGLRACFLGMPLALIIPSPRRWIALSHVQAFGVGCEAGADEFDSASMYVADFLRVFSEAGLDALLLDEAGDTEPMSSNEIEWYRPVLNVAMHYRWTLGLRLPRAESSTRVWWMASASLLHRVGSLREPASLHRRRSGPTVPRPRVCRGSSVTSKFRLMPTPSASSTGLRFYTNPATRSGKGANCARSLGGRRDCPDARSA